MNQKDRILELVDKGIISAEEAVVLLEKMGDKAVEEKEQPTTSQLDSIMEGVASAFTKFSAESDQTDEAIQTILKRTKEIDRRIDEIRTASQLESLTVDEEIDDFTYFNAETIEAIEETERNLKNSNRKRYSSIQELREALENN